MTLNVVPLTNWPTEGAVDVRVLERAVVDHLLRAGVAFFTGLEAEHERPR
jgi:hypothetical protein